MSGTVVLGKQGRLVVPADLRAELGFAEGDVLHVQRMGTRLVIERPGDAARGLVGLLAEKSAGRSLVEELLAERVAEGEAVAR